MSQTQNPSFIGRVTRSGAPAKPRVLLGVCGKHRSYREHFDDLDRQPDLVAVKELLYDRGIREAVDRGVWKDVRGTPDFVEFGHTLIGRRGATGEWIVARIVKSPDAVGRDDYPLLLIALARIVGDVNAAVADMVARLRSLEAAIRPADSLNDVTAAIAEARAALTGSIVMSASAAPDGASSEPTPSALVALADDPTFAGEGRRGLLNALYQFQRQIGMRGGTGEAASGRKVVDRALHLRVPVANGTDPIEAAVRWDQLIVQEAVLAVDSLVFFADDSSDYIDLIVGPPAASDFHFIHASSAKMPVIDQIPYQLDEAFVSRIEERIAVARGAPPTLTPSQGTRAAMKRAGFGGGAMVASIIVGILIVAGALAATWYFLLRH